MIISIDGSAGSGKSTAARKLAARLEIPYLDTGAMYRAIAYWVLRNGVDASDPAAILDLARSIQIDVDCGPTHTRTRIDGHDVSESIRSMEVSNATSAVARIQEIRELLVKKQREIAAHLGSLVTEGRDQGSVVFPNADCKFVLDASIEKRAERRLHEIQAEGEEVTMEEIVANLRSRDANDAIQWTPLLESGKAIRIDTSHLTIAQVVDRLLEHVNAALDSASRPTEPEN